MKLTKKGLKGTMTITELWSNKERSNFLRENKIKMNKMKFMEKITSLQKKMEPSHKRFRSMESIRTIDEIKCFGTKEFL